MSFHWLFNSDDVSWYARIARAVMKTQKAITTAVLVVLSSEANQVSRYLCDEYLSLVPFCDMSLPHFAHTKASLRTPEQQYGHSQLYGMQSVNNTAKIPKSKPSITQRMALRPLRSAIEADATAHIIHTPKNIGSDSYPIISTP